MSRGGGSIYSHSIFFKKTTETRNSYTTPDVQPPFQKNCVIATVYFMKRTYLKSSLLLVLLGICLGNLARLIFGAPDDGPEFPRKFSQPLPADFQPSNKDDTLDIQLSPLPDQSNNLVPPISLPARIESQKTSGNWANLSSTDHDSLAIFEPHGDEVCASGCALSRHPTGTLTTQRFNTLLNQFSAEPIDQSSKPLEELLFFGPQTEKLLNQKLLNPASKTAMDSAHTNYLQRELKRTHAKISIRVIEQDGTLRCWLPPTRVPFDRRHVFEMKTESLQPLVTSGTIKRVGLNHIWARL